MSPPLLLSWLLACSPPAEPEAPAVEDPSDGLPAMPGPPTPLDAQAFRATVEERATREIDCEDSYAAFLCRFRDGDARPTVLPALPETHLGLQFGVRRSRTLERGANETIGVSRLDLGPDGVWVETVRPASSTSYRALQALIDDLADALTGRRADVRVDPMIPVDLALDPPGWRPLLPDAGGDGLALEHPARFVTYDGEPTVYAVFEPLEGGGRVHVFPAVPRTTTLPDAPVDDGIGIP